jgi:hypothetical protein
VTDVFANLAVDQGVRRLSRWNSMVLIYEGSSEQPSGAILTELWVSGSPSGTPIRNATGVGNSDGPKLVSAEATWTPAIRRQQEPDLRPPGLTNAIRFGPSDSRSQIVQALVRERGEYAVVGILREAATQDPDPRIRRGAIQILASLNDPSAVDAVQATLHDPHSGVRYEAEMALRRLRRERSNNSSGE